MKKLAIRNLAWTTVGFVYLLMVWGNIVSSTGSGLACPDWPLCHGTFFPPLSFEIVLEWGHRLLAFSATLLILTTLFKVFTSPDSKQSALRRSGKVLLALLALQIPLGGITVLLGLSIWVSTIHLVIATLVWSGLIAIACAATWDKPALPSMPPKIRRLAVAGLIGILVQFALGALVRHGHAGLACPQFPNCMDSFFPLPFTFETATAFIHRWWGILLLGVFIHLTVATAQTAPKLAAQARRILGVSLAQVLLGIGTVMSGLHTHTRATHAAIGYALWGMLFYFAIRAGSFRFLWEKK